MCGYVIHDDPDVEVRSQLWKFRILSLFFLNMSDVHLAPSVQMYESENTVCAQQAGLIFLPEMKSFMHFGVER